MMNRNVKIGVNSQASRLIGSAPGWAGPAGAAGRGDRVARGVDAAAARREAQRDRDGRDQQDRSDPDRCGERHASGASLANRVVPAGSTDDKAIRLAPIQLPHEAVLRWPARVAGARGLESTTRRQPREHDR